MTNPESTPANHEDDIEAVIACLGDDAAGLRDDNPEDERADSMDVAAATIRSLCKQLDELRATPATVGAAPEEPEFYTIFAEHEGGWIPLPGYSNETENGVRDLVLQTARREGYKGTVTGRLLDLGWRVGPVYATPAAPKAAPQEAMYRVRAGLLRADVFAERLACSQVAENYMREVPCGDQWLASNTISARILGRSGDPDALSPKLPPVHAASVVLASPAAAPPPAVSAPQTVRVLTPMEWQHLLPVFHDRGLIPFSDELQRKLFAVNGLTIAAPTKED